MAMFMEVNFSIEPNPLVNNKIMGQVKAHGSQLICGNLVKSCILDTFLVYLFLSSIIFSPCEY